MSISYSELTARSSDTCPILSQAPNALPSDPLCHCAPTLVPPAARAPDSRQALLAGPGRSVRGRHRGALFPAEGNPNLEEFYPREDRVRHAHAARLGPDPTAPAQALHFLLGEGFLDAKMGRRGASGKIWRNGPSCAAREGVPRVLHERGPIAGGGGRVGRGASEGGVPGADGGWSDGGARRSAVEGAAGDGEDKRIRSGAAGDEDLGRLVI